jgi:PTH1 family peptidyl-tRNA hydrolase
MKLIVGLGNPETKYLLTRHNIGFILADALHHYFEGAAYKAKFSGFLSTIEIDKEECVLLKPATYMNRSGESVQKVMQFYKIKLQDVIIFHDDLDLDPFQIKIKKGGGAAGHNGLKSIDTHCGNDYWRYRFGIGRPPLKNMVSDYVLSNFTNTEITQIKEFLNFFAKDFTLKIFDKML